MSTLLTLVSLISSFSTFDSGGNVVLPTSLTALEFQNRNHTKHFDFLKILKPLKNLESISMSHADFSAKGQFTEFLDAIDGEILPKLAFLVCFTCSRNSDPFRP